MGRQRDALRSLLNRLKTFNEPKVAGVQAELFAARWLINNGVLADGGKIALNSTQKEQVNLGNGVSVPVDPMTEADIMYPGKDGLAYSSEVKSTAKAYADKTRKHPGQADRAERWLKQSPLYKTEAFIVTDEGWTQLFSLTDREDNDSYVVNSLIKGNTALRIGDGWHFSPNQLKIIRVVVVQALKESKQRPKEFFAEEMPDLTKATDYLRKRGVDFL